MEREMEKGRKRRRKRRGELVKEQNECEETREGKGR